MAMSARPVAAGISLLALVAAGAPGPAGATAPGKNGRIAFMRFRPPPEIQTSDIFVANAGGTGTRQVTQAPAGYRDDVPDWSSDGSRIAFERCAPAGGTCLVMSIRPDGTGLRRLSAPCVAACADDRSPVFSPDARHIAFVRSGGTLGASPTLMVADAGLRHPRTVLRATRLSGSPYAIAWSPSGKQLAFASFDAGAGGRALFAVGVDGTGLQRLTPWSLQAGGRPDWSPDGSRILFRSYSNREGGFGANLYTVRSDGSGLRRVTHAGLSDRVLGGTYSPAGTSIVVSATAGATDGDDGAPDIFVIRADGTGKSPVTRSRSWDAAPDWGPRP
jgi:TolB protein